MRRPTIPSVPAPVMVAAALLAGMLAGGCDTGAPPATPPITPGTAEVPRAVNVIAREYAFVPPVVDLVPGETVVFRVVNAGLEIHEAVVGDLDSQLAWESAERATVGHPPGPTPFVAPPVGFDGVRVVVASGQRLDVAWTVPTGAPAPAGGWFVGCHIPGHWQKGMVVPIRFVDAGGVPIASPPAAPASSPDG